MMSHWGHPKTTTRHETWAAQSEGVPKKTSPTRERSPARETSKKTLSRENPSRAIENDAFASQFQSASTSETTCDEKITRVQGKRFHPLVDNAMLGTLGETK